MPNTIRFPLRNISPETIADLQEKYPNASVQIELSDQPVEGGLSEEAFWELIALLDWNKTGDDDAVIEPVIARLSNTPLRHIYDFKDILSQKLYLLDGISYARHIGTYAYRGDSTDFQPDIFLFARCCAVANGQEAFYEILKKPELMPAKH